MNISMEFGSKSRCARSRVVRLAAVFLLIAHWAACGDVYRPVANPIPGPSPSPQPVGHVYSVSANGLSSSNALFGRGSMSRIDVSGDSVISSFTSGLAPVHAALTVDGTRLYVVNSGEDTVTASPNAFTSQAVTIDLVPVCDSAGCPAVHPVFIQTTEGGKMYVAGSGNGTISFIDTNNNAVSRTVAVNPAFAANPPGQPLPLPDRNSRPTALAELPNGSKIYSANSGNNTVSAVNTVDGTVARVIGLGASPVYVVAAGDSAHVFVLDSSGTISVIDTLSDAVVSSVPAGAGANFLFYDRTFNRIYVTDANPASPALRLFDISGSTLVPHGAGIAPIAAAPGSLCSSAPLPTSVTVLGDGSRAYVASYQADPNLVCAQATVIDTGTGLVTKTIALPQAPNISSQNNCDLARFRVFAASSNGGTSSNFKVYVSQCDAGLVSVIDTTAISTGADQHGADVLMAWLPSPVSSFPASQIAITGISTSTPSTCPSPTSASYTYSLLSGGALQPGMTVYVTGMKSLNNNGAFVVTSATPSTFTVLNSCPTQDGAAQNGTGSVFLAQSPVFLVPGP